MIYLKIFVLGSWAMGPLFWATPPECGMWMDGPCDTYTPTIQKKCIKTMGKGMGSISRCRILFDAQKLGGCWQHPGWAPGKLANVSVFRLRTNGWSHDWFSPPRRTEPFVRAVAARYAQKEEVEAQQRHRNGNATNRDKYMTVIKELFRWYSINISCIAMYCTSLSLHRK